MKLNKYFDRDEFSCGCGCGFSTVDVEQLQLLTTIREHFNKPVTITSACRCYEYNEAIGGAYGSKHKQGIAADIVVKDIAPEQVYNFVDNHMPDRGGIGLYESFTHVDVRQKKARWRG